MQKIIQVKKTLLTGTVHSVACSSGTGESDPHLHFACVCMCACVCAYVNVCVYVCRLAHTLISVFRQTVKFSLVSSTVKPHSISIYILLLISYIELEHV